MSLAITDDQLVELFEERVAIMLEGCPRFTLGSTDQESEAQAKRQAYFDIKRRYNVLIMPVSTRPDGFDKPKARKGPDPSNLKLWSE